MKIAIYELLGMIKDGKAPKKIRYSSYIFKYTGDKRISRMYVMENQETYLFRDMVVTLTSEVEILETTLTMKDDKFTGVKYYDDGIEIASMDYSTHYSMEELAEEDDRQDNKIDKIDVAWQNVFDEQAQQDFAKMTLNKINEIIDRINNE